jgi:hypothetical protein
LDFRYGKRTKIDFHKNFHRTRTTLEANAAMRSIVRRDTGASYEEFLEAIVFLSNLLAFGATTIAAILQGPLGSGDQRQCGPNPDVDGVDRDAGAEVPAVEIDVLLVVIDAGGASAAATVLLSRSVGVVG